MLRRVTFLLLVLAVPGTALAQAFVTPYGFDKMLGEAYTILNDGTRVEGDLRNTSGVQYTISSFAIKMEDGEKRKFKAADVQQLVLRLGKLARMELVTDYGRHDRQGRAARSLVSGITNNPANKAET